MKKLLFILSLTLLCFAGAKAQTTFQKPLVSDHTIHKAGLDTASGAVAVTQIAQVSGSWAWVTVQAAVNKLTGAPVGSLKLYGSVDGVKYDYVTTAIDSLAVTNVSTPQVKTWKLVPPSFQYFKIIYKPTGTETSTLSTSAYGSK